jgi:hypothetical protein
MLRQRDAFGYVEYVTKIEWEGEAPVRESREAAIAFWGRMRRDHQFEDVRMIGESADRVRAIGRVTAFRTGRFYQAEYVWARHGSELVLWSMRVGDRAPEATDGSRTQKAGAPQ